MTFKDRTEVLISNLTREEIVGYVWRGIQHDYCARVRSKIDDIEFQGELINVMSLLEPHYWPRIDNQIEKVFSED